MKKNICIVALLIFSTFITKSQNLIGTWQEGTAEVADGYLNTYHFFPDGTFHYNTTGYDELRRILTIGGKYKIKDKKLILIIEYTIELLGGGIERSRISTLSDSWSILDGKVEKILLKVPLFEKISFNGITKKAEYEYFLIDKIKYFKVKDTPDDGC